MLLSCIVGSYWGTKVANLYLVISVAGSFM